MLAQIARAQGLQKRFDDAWQTLSQAEQLLAAGKIGAGVAAAARASVELEAGRLLNTAGRDDRGAARFAKALDVAERAGCEDLAIDALHMLAIIDPGPNEAQAWNQRALDAATCARSPEGRRWRGSILNNMGWAHHEAGRLDLALDCFERALQARIALAGAGDASEPGQSEVRVARWCVARCLRSMGRIETALQIQQRLLQEGLDAGSSDGHVHRELAECMRALGRHADAAAHDAHASRLLERA